MIIIIIIIKKTKSLRMTSSSTRSVSDHETIKTRLEEDAAHGYLRTGTVTYFPLNPSVSGAILSKLQLQIGKNYPLTATRQSTIRKQ